MGGTDIDRAYHNPTTVATAINNLAAADRPAATAAYLRAIHKEITIAKINAFLTRDPVANATALLDRPTHTDPTKLDRANANEYRQYPAFIRGLAATAYTAAKLNLFVEELGTNAKNALAAQVET